MTDEYTITIKCYPRTCDDCTRAFAQRDQRVNHTIMWASGGVVHALRCDADSTLCGITREAEVKP